MNMLSKQTFVLANDFWNFYLRTRLLTGCFCLGTVIIYSRFPALDPRLEESKANKTDRKSITGSIPKQPVHYTFLNGFNSLITIGHLSRRRYIKSYLNLSFVVNIDMNPTSR